MMISSGNDAAVELAIRVSGSVPAFVARMNEFAAEYGFDRFSFYDSAGLDPRNTISAISFARFSGVVSREFPSLLTIASQRSFTFEDAGITQDNRNGLIETYDGALGLKTGFIDESGYNIAVVADRDGMRLIAVVLGVSADSHPEGARRRESDARRLLDWGYETYRRVAVAAPSPEPIAVLGGARRSVETSVDVPQSLLLLSSQVDDLSGRIAVDEHVWAPVEAGTRVGTLTIASGSCTIAEYPIVVAQPVESGGIVRSIVDRFLLWWRETIPDGISVRENS
jgi:D-alanyl-D-alanine carboxypeptidase (penicillin-binding protein 5/6)